MVAKVELERVQMETRAAWRAWLTKNHASSPGIWLVTFKKGSGKPKLDYDDLVEEALCFGWVDSRANALDVERSMLMLTPRKPGSGWSRTNKERIERLTAAGSMMPAGLAKVETAKVDGSWSALDNSEALIVPDDLAAVLAEHETARANFDAFAPSIRKQLIQWVESAKRPETRSTRVEKVVGAALAKRNPLTYVPKEKR